MLYTNRYSIVILLAIFLFKLMNIHNKDKSIYTGYKSVLELHSFDQSGVFILGKLAVCTYSHSN